MNNFALGDNLGHLEVKVFDKKIKYEKKKSNNLYVKNFPLSYSDKDLFDIFEKFGQISSICIKKDEES
jgi:RNA recognition motif-containing protein